MRGRGILNSCNISQQEEFRVLRRLQHCFFMSRFHGLLREKEAWRRTDAIELYRFPINMKGINGSYTVRRARQLSPQLTHTDRRHKCLLSVRAVAARYRDGDKGLQEAHSLASPSHCFWFGSSCSPPATRPGGAPGSTMRDAVITGHSFPKPDTSFASGGFIGACTHMQTPLIVPIGQ